MSRFDREDAFAYFAESMRRREFEIPWSLDGYQEELRRRANLKRDAWERQWWEQFESGFGRTYGPPPFSNAIEVITDPRDRRGFNARRIN